ncbi:hypothetical protein GWK16_16285 [Roseomonas sp. JC162]|uniref:Uncharacterized protein n=1 Tax=Neoroseomonas marina TaxID=1232220 RepID=A0A848EHA6_9PROT|nr:hypothetical protein [Neoroseomonas marina]NMJ42805.1 hypothetical protein [Neoroseomonas marina]
MPDAEMDRASALAEMARISRESFAHARAPGATPDQVEAATDAIRAEFAARGVTALEAFEGSSACELWEDFGFLDEHKPTEREIQGGGAWDAAIIAAAHAVYGPDVTLRWPDERIDIAVYFPQEEYEVLKDIAFPERARAREEEDAAICAALREQGIDPDNLPPLPF